MSSFWPLLFDLTFRRAGIASPIVTGILLSISVSLPLYVAAILFVGAAACMIALPYETRVVQKGALHRKRPSMDV